jgi:hypothetical protein
MSFNPELWASVFNVIVFISLIVLPWATGRSRTVTMVAGVGGIVVLLAVDIFAGYQQSDYGLAQDLALLTLLKGVFFFFLSLMVERVFRLHMQTRHANKAPESPQDKIVRERFEREMRGLRKTDDTAPK